MLGRVNTPPEEFENGGFNLKTHQIFFVHTTPEEFENGVTHQTFFVYFPPERNLKRRFQSENASNIFRPHYDRGI